MAGGKETPRQKMIGIMYLVLMTLLALNVSKEIINAFVTQDNQMLTTNNNLVNSINGFLTKFSLVELDPNTKKKYEKWKPKIDKTVALANKLDDYIIENQNMMMKEAEGKDNWFTKNEESQLTTWIDFEAINKKDDYDTPTRLFGGESSTAGYKTGAEIRTKLIELRDSLILEMGSYTERGKTYQITQEALASDSTLVKYLEEITHPDKEKLLSIYQTLSQPEKLKNHGEDEDWQIVKFDHQPIVGAIGVFTELRNQIRMAEQKALELVYGKLDQQIMPINKIEPQIIANTRYINVGDTIGVKVGIVAYDSTAKYPIKYVIGGEEITSEDNNFTVKGTSAGNQSVEGVLSLNLADGKKDFPWKFDYTVGQPMGTIALPEYEVIYGDNYENIIEGTASGYAPDDVSVSCPECKSFTRKGTVYVAKANPGQEVKVFVKAPGLTYSKTYKVLPLPKPILKYQGGSEDKKAIPTSLIQTGNTIHVKSPESSPLKIKYEVVSFQAETSIRGRLITSKVNMGSRFNDEVKGMVKNISRGQNITFTNVKYRVVGDSKVKNLSDLKLKGI